MIDKDLARKLGDNVIDIKEELEDGFYHVVPVKATITIEDL